MLRSVRTIVAASAALAAAPVTLAAQEAQEAAPITAEEALINSDQLWTMESIVPEEVDPCAEFADDPTVIVVCRQAADPAQFMIERRTRADSDVTGDGAPAAQDPGSEFGLRPCSEASACIGGLGSVPPPAFMVDFDSLPETPEGSDAARYGGPTDARVVTDTIVSARHPDRETPVAEEVEEQINIGLETQRGIDDDIYGP